MATTQAPLSQEAILNAFKSLDANGDGILSKEELQKGFAAAHDEHKGELSEEQLTGLLKNCKDVDGEGGVDYKEFLEFYITSVGKEGGA